MSRFQSETRFTHALTLLLAGAAAWFVPAAGIAEIVLQPEIEIPFLEHHYFDTTAILEDGTFAISGTTTTEPTDEHPGHPQFEVQIYSPQGEPVGPPFVPQPVSVEGIGTVSSLGDRFFVSWQRAYDQISRATQIGKVGEILVKPFPWPNSNIEFYGNYYRYGGGPRWLFLPVTYREDGVNWLGYTILKPTVQVYGRDAKPVGHAAPVVGEGSTIYIFDAAINDAGRFVVVSDQCPRTGPAKKCVWGLQVFDASGNPQTGFLKKGIPQPFSRSCLSCSQPLVAMDSTGDFLVGWSEKPPGGEERIGLRFFDKMGVAGSQVVTAALSKLSDGSVLLRLISLGSGRYLVFWAVFHPDGAGTLYLAELQPGPRLSKPLSIEVGKPAAFEYYPIKLNGSGKGILTWTTFEGPGAFTGHLRFISIN